MGSVFKNAKFKYKIDLSEAFVQILIIITNVINFTLYMTIVEHSKRILKIHCINNKQLEALNENAKGKLVKTK